MINSFSCKNFRNINVADLELSRINIFIGPNNSGKTNLIKTITFYSNMLKHAAEGNEGTDFMNAMARNGWNHSKNYLAPINEPVSFEWHLNYNSQPVVYKFAYSVGENREDYHIALEELNAESPSSRYQEAFNYYRAHKEKVGNGKFSTATTKGKENKRIPVQLSSIETVISQFDRILLNEESLYNAKTVRNDINALIKEIEKAFKSFYSYSSVEFDTKRIRRRGEANAFDQFLLRDGTKLLKKNSIRIESYAHADNGGYRKLSDDINTLIADQNKKDCTEFFYSKRGHGSQMLLQIDPGKVREKCTIHFSRGYFVLKKAVLG